MSDPGAATDGTAKPVKGSLTIQNALSIIIVVSFVTLIFVWIFFPPAGDSNTYSMLNILIGFLGAAFGTVVQFHLGSSKGSEDKTDTIKQMAVNSVAGTGDGSITGGAGVVGARRDSR
ncbi:MAG: hypothetical protein JWP25_8968 [Bradyrhizobium sp.]|nr:hypothetical protein [Bradyrhizobium sp.]